MRPILLFENSGKYLNAKNPTKLEKIEKKEEIRIVVYEFLY